MTKIKAIATKELLFFLNSPFGYLYLFVILVITNWLFFSDFFVNNLSTFESLFSNFYFILIFFIPVVTMNSLADEKKQGNWEVILSLPVTDLELLIGKFLGILAYSLMSLIVLIPSFATVFILGNPDAGIFIGQILATIFLLSSYISAGIFFSSLTSQPLMSFIFTFTLLLLNNLIVSSMVMSRIPLPIGQFFQFISLSERVNTISTGLLDIANLLFFFSWVSIFIIASSLVLKKRKL